MAQKNQVLKGFLMGIADYAQNKANETKLKAQLALNSEKMKQNWLWKIQAEAAQRKLENQETMDFVNRTGTQGEGVSETGGFEIGAPEARMGAGGKMDVHYPTATDKEFKIKQTWAQIDRKQARNLPLNNLEKAFVEAYPKESFLKRDVNAEKFDVQQGEAKKTAEVQVRNEQDFTQDMLDTIGEVKKGIKYFGAAGAVPPFPAEYSKTNWLANFNKLVSKRVLDTMTQLKKASKTGATGFGQLSEKELAVLQDASTVLKKNMSEEDAIRYLIKMENVLTKVSSQPQTQEQPGENGQYQEGAVYKDASGNKAKYQNGQFIPLQ